MVFNEEAIPNDRDCQDGKNDNNFLILPSEVYFQLDLLFSREVPVTLFLFPKFPPLSFAPIDCKVGCIINLGEGFSFGFI